MPNKQAASPMEARLADNDDRINVREVERMEEMPLWIAWLRDNWMSILLGAGVIVAVIFVLANRKLLFFKE